MILAGISHGNSDGMIRMQHASAGESKQGYGKKGADERIEREKEEEKDILFRRRKKCSMI